MGSAADKAAFDEERAFPVNSSLLTENTFLGSYECSSSDLYNFIIRCTTILLVYIWGCHGSDRYESLQCERSTSKYVKFMPSRDFSFWLWRSDRLERKISRLSATKRTRNAVIPLENFMLVCEPTRDQQKAVAVIVVVVQWASQKIRKTSNRCIHERRACIITIPKAFRSAHKLRPKIFRFDLYI